ncbi:hypothetical protein ACFLQ3_01560 [Bacteroidota bacterium]
MALRAQVSSKIDENTFNISVEENRLFLLFEDQKIKMAEGEEWLMGDVYSDIYEEVFFIDSLPRPAVDKLPKPNGVKAIKLSGNYYLLLISFYHAPSDAKIAFGLDLFLTFNTRSKELRSFSPDLVFSMGRGPGPCRNSTMTSYLLQDVNKDGFIDVGVIHEMIKCDYENDIPSKPYFTQQPIKWYVDIKDEYSLNAPYWIPIQLYAGILPKSYTELTSLTRTPIDMVGEALWKTNNRLNWPSKMDEDPLITKSKKKEMIKEAKKIGDKNGLKRLNAYQYLRPILPINIRIKL